ncbi:MAG: hypothetical protein ABMA15_22225 [Vicinamibacterales bacterium]
MRTKTVGWQRATVAAAVFCVLIGGALAIAAETPCPDRVPAGWIALT